ncbi:MULTISPECIES: hypothetical protein [unclassified Herbaspirillum]|uniref:hypothetical protein n=1 Tax=unclassified Herbaspirillum TaxID=2624150 RepID=UPI00114E7039|nr:MULTISPECIES: hypothetical protein [unclassified Herbaspirillum]MBB5390516.1 hypothetical protein [Herbaspirillum sp. SJZ102]TQK08992.1 hypothetical protein FB599_1350 [Herbaspirillum sp. SJZ130]TQK14321.1 hypothetical protein FB598_1692 [Herbaspirillum sp. SJZ106]
MTKNEQLQSMIQLYKSETGNITVDMELVADWAIQRGATLPKPKSARDLLVAQLADAARAEYRQDSKTGLSYRANHALRVSRKDGKQYTLWVDIEDATRAQMSWSLSNRRQQMVGDAVHLKIDEMIWNDRHPEEQPIQLVMDFTDDVEERLNSPGFGSGAAA